MTVFYKFSSIQFLAFIKSTDVEYLTIEPSINFLTSSLFQFSFADFILIVLPALLPEHLYNLSSLPNLDFVILFSMSVNVLNVKKAYNKEEFIRNT